MKVIVDMNLSPRWVGFLSGEGSTAAHWSDVGDIRAPDSVIADWARCAGQVILTTDLDFAALLATSAAEGPSVVQLRTQDVLPDASGALVVRILRGHAEALDQGALVTIDVAGARVRILPIPDRR